MFATENYSFSQKNRAKTVPKTAADAARAPKSTARGLGTEQGTGTVDHPVPRRPSQRTLLLINHCLFNIVSSLWSHVYYKKDL